jgi:hypothetical protein
VRVKLAAIVFAALAAAYAVYGVRRQSRRFESGGSAAALQTIAGHVASHPSDWLAASALTEIALDARDRDRLALWRASHALAAWFAPRQPEPRVAFARSGFFHWTEIGDADRKAVLEAYAPELGDPMTFDRSYRELFALTGDLDYLRRAGPPEAAQSLARLAAAYGRFDDYRALRAEIERSGKAAPPEPPQEIARDRWTGLCGEDVCRSGWREIEATRSIAIGVKTTWTDDVAPYVEIYVDGERRTEGDLGSERTFTVDVAPGVHRVEVRLANVLTRNNERRTIRITSVRAV